MADVLAPRSDGLPPATCPAAVARCQKGGVQEVPRAVRRDRCADQGAGRAVRGAREALQRDRVHQNDAWRADGRRRGSAQGGERDATCRGGSATRKGWRARGEVGRCGGGGVEGRRLDPLRRTPLCSPCVSIYLLRLAAALCVCVRQGPSLFDEPSLVAREYVLLSFMER